MVHRQVYVITWDDYDTVNAEFTRIVGTEDGIMGYPGISSLVGNMFINSLVGDIRDITSLNASPEINKLVGAISEVHKIIGAISVNKLGSEIDISDRIGNIGISGDLDDTTNSKIIGDISIKKMSADVEIKRRNSE